MSVYKSFYLVTILLRVFINICVYKSFCLVTILLCVCLHSSSVDDQEKTSSGPALVCECLHRHSHTHPTPYHRTCARLPPPYALHPTRKPKTLALLLNANTNILNANTNSRPSARWTRAKSDTGSKDKNCAGSNRYFFPPPLSFAPRRLIRTPCQINTKGEHQVAHQAVSCRRRRRWRRRGV